MNTPRIQIRRDVLGEFGRYRVVGEQGTHIAFAVDDVDTIVGQIVQALDSFNEFPDYVELPELVRSILVTGSDLV